MELYQEPDLYEDEAIIVSVDRDDDDYLVELDATIFYPGGGGQPHDVGIITGKDFGGKVAEVYKVGNRILHRVSLKKGKPREGAQVRLEVDRDRRDALVRMHTGEHILFRSIQKILEKRDQQIKLEKINLSTDGSSIFIVADAITWDDLFASEELANRIIKENRQILHHEIKSDQLKSFPRYDEVRINEERVDAETVRITEIKDFDLSACMGTHAHTTGFVGNILITGFNITKGSYEVQFTTAALPTLHSYATELRKISTLLEIPAVAVEGRVRKLLEDNEKLTVKVRELSYEAAGNVSEEMIGGVRLLSAVLDGLEHKQLVDKAKELLAPDVLVCMVNRQERSAEVMLMSQKDLNLDIPGSLKQVLEPLGGKGGGRDQAAMGGCGLEQAEKVIPALRELLEQRSR